MQIKDENSTLREELGRLRIDQHRTQVPLGGSAAPCWVVPVCVAVLGCCRIQSPAPCAHFMLQQDLTPSHIPCCLYALR